MAVKNVIIYNRVDSTETRLYSAKVSLINRAGITLESIQLYDNAKQAPYSDGIFDVKFTPSDGSARVVQKRETDCKRLGPITSGFNEAACDIFQGTWCPQPRDCSKLVNCVNAIMTEVNSTSTQQAFLKYLDGAPKIKLNEVGYL